MLLLAVAAAAAVLFWSLVKPRGPVGDWRSNHAAVTSGDPLLLTRFDPFFRDASAGGPVAVTSLPLKLFGTRLDQAMGRGSAIIATPDGVQGSYAVGDEIVPGVRLKAVAFDNVTVERGGTAEQLFIDQSVAAKTVIPVATAAAVGAPSPIAVPQIGLSGQAISAGIGFTPQVVNGAVTGFEVAPLGSGTVFATAGLRPGDVLVQVNSVILHSASDASTALAKTPPGGFAGLTVLRGGKTVNLSVKMAP